MKGTRDLRPLRFVTEHVVKENRPPVESREVLICMLVLYRATG